MPKKEPHKDSTTDFFLKFITRQKEEKATKKDTNIEIEEEDETAKEKTFIFVLKSVNNINILLDKMLSSKVSVKVLSFVMTVLLVFVINGGSIDSILSLPTSGDRLKDVKIVVEGLSKEFEVSGVPEKIDVFLIGTKVDIYATKVSNNYEVYLDLTNYVEGEYVVEYKYRNFPSGLNVLVASEKTTVKISPKSTQTFELGYQFINDEEYLDDNQSVSVTSMEHTEVEVRASQDLIDKIYSVNAVVDLKSVDVKDGTFSQKAKIKAMDRSGEVVKVEIIPKTVNVECQISSYSKEVTITPNIIGKVESGYAISSIHLGETKVKIYGDEEKLKNIQELHVDVDVTGINDTRTKKGVSIKPIDGINRMSSTEIDIVVDVEKAEVKRITNIPITAINNPNNFKISFVEGEYEASVDVTAATSLIEKITANDFKAVIDLEELQEGQNRVFVSVVSTNYLLDCVLISKEKLIITLER